MACGYDRPLSRLTPRGHGGAALSVLLHLAVAAMLLNGRMASPPAEEAPPLTVDIVMESAPPAATAMAEPAVPASPRPPSVRPRPPVAKAPPPITAASDTAAAPTAPPEAVNPAKPEAAAPPGSIPANSTPVEAATARRVVEEADFGAYVGHLRESIVQHRVYPPQAIRRHEEGDVRLRILLAKDGRLLDILNLAEASAHLTQAARQAVESAAPFAPPPEGGAPDRQIAFDVTIAFRLR